MKLELTSEDVKRILIEWGQAHFPGAGFNDATFSGYSYSREVTLWTKEAEEPETLKAVA